MREAHSAAVVDATVDVVDDLELTEYCRALWPRLVGGLSLHCGEPAVAEELAQETLVRVWQRWDTIRSRDSRDGWVWTVALNLSRSRYRRTMAARRARARLGPEPDQVDLTVEVDLAVREAVADLPPRQRAAIVLRHFADLSIAGTAGVMGCAEGTVGAHTNKAMKALRMSLGESDVDAEQPPGDDDPGQEVISRA